jgi:hypothetical protein
MVTTARQVLPTLLLVHLLIHFARHLAARQEQLAVAQLPQVDLEAVAEVLVAFA